MEKTKNTILFTTNYLIYSKSDQRKIKKEQHLLKHLIFVALTNNPNIEGLRVILYIHARFGDRTKNDYEFIKKNSKIYNRIMQMEDFIDIGPVENYRMFLYKNIIPL